MHQINKVSLKETYNKQGYVLISKGKFVTRGSQGPNLVFFLGAMFQDLLLQYSH